tara:strand:- start:543 stop:740 length:198 start_codon:yes stop_codon:yes gene_type:complete
MILRIGNVVEHEEFWDHEDGETQHETFTVTAIEEYDPDEPHQNVWVRDANGKTRHFDETELEIVG